MRILVIDDDPDLLLTLQAFLKKNGFEVLTAANGKGGLKLLDKKTDLVICDIKLPDFTGLEILSRIKKLQPSVPVIMITGYSDVNTVVEALRRGAEDYVTKPLYPDEILLQIKGIEKRLYPNKSHSVPNDASLDQSQSSEEANSIIGSDYVVGNSSAMLSLDKNIQLVAGTELSVVILGETGSGKEYVARRLHALSRRKDKPFMALDCGALPTDIASGELFGYKKGAFTGALTDKVGIFEAVNGGTLFLDEIGNLHYENQVKLLRVLQEKKVMRLGDTKERPVDFRLLVATNESLANRMVNGEFREDLYYRLNEYSIHLPPLRERSTDKMVYAKHFLSAANSQMGKSIKGFSPEVEAKFNSYRWPGNLREMNNLVKRCVLVCQNDEIAVGDIPMEMIASSTPNGVMSTQGNHSLKYVVEVAEKQAIINALRKYQFNKSEVARALDIDRKTLYNKMNQYNIEL